MPSLLDFAGLRVACVAVSAVLASLCGDGARAEDDGAEAAAKVSDSLEAIAHFGSSDTKDAINANTVTLVTGTIGGSYVQIGADLASVLDDGRKLRVLPIVGRGSVGSVSDILFLRGVDLGIVRADSIDYLERKGFAKGIKKQFAYITKLYNEEMMVIAPKELQSLRDLNGKRVSVDLPDGGTFVTALNVFEELGLKASFFYVEQRIAMEKLKNGELDAVIVVGGKPYRSVSTFENDGRYHLLRVDYDKPLREDYLPARLTSADYPNLISRERGQVDTIAVPAVLAAYNWPANTDRYRRLALFVDAFFNKFPSLQKPPFHPAWKEVSLSATLAGWTRFPAADQWLDSHGLAAGPDRGLFDMFLDHNPGEASRGRTDADKAELFKEFEAWKRQTRGDPGSSRGDPGSAGQKATHH